MISRFRSFFARLIACPVPYAALLVGMLLWPAMSREVAWGDALEFCATARTLGVPHPTGYPLHMLLSGSAVLGAPMNAVAWRLNLLSWLATVVSAGLLAHIIRRIALRIVSREFSFTRPAWWVAVAVPVFTLTGATGRELGTTAEVYSVALALSLFLAHQATLLGDRPRSEADRWLIATALVAGLACGHHRLVAIAAVGWGIVALDWIVRQRAWRTFAAAVAAGVLGLSVWAALPIRAAGNPVINWGAPDSAERFAWVARGGEFLQFRFLSPRPGQRVGLSDGGYFRTQLAEGVSWWMKEVWPWPWAAALEKQRHELNGWAAYGDTFPAGPLVAGIALLSGIGAGLTIIGRRHFAGAVAWALQLAAWSGVYILYNIADPEGYAWILFVFASVPLAIATIAALDRWENPGAMAGPLIGAALLAWPAMSAVTANDLVLRRMIDAEVPRGVAERRASLPFVWGRLMLDAAPPNAVMITSGDNDIFALWFQQFVFSHRLDVIPVGGNFLKNGWYARMIAAHPAMVLGLTTGGETPRSAGEFAARLWNQAMKPALENGRPVLWLNEDDAVRQALEPVAIVGEPMQVIPQDVARAIYASGIIAPPPMTARMVQPRLE